MKYVLLTGAGGGLGSACAQALAGAGWVVFAADIDQAALGTPGQIPGIIPLVLDITDQDSVDGAVTTVQATTDRLDAVINFAGVHTMGSLVEPETGIPLVKMIDINLMGMVRVNRAFFDLVREAKGRIINCSSECGYMKAQPFNGPYTITKYAVEAYSDALRRELLCHGVKVIKLQPGSFKTNLHSAAQAGFDELYANTGYYQAALTRMQPLMKWELARASDPKYVVRALLKAVSQRHPKLNYRVKNSKLLGLFELLPNRVVDAIYRHFLLR
jgi:NAD(P)-dependent dehydrogenase (short-subunit alcohol dehydrogenase family)